MTLAYSFRRQIMECGNREKERLGATIAFATNTLRRSFLAQITIREALWEDIIAMAQRQRQKAEILVENVLRDYVRRIADEELLARSEQAARRSKFRIGETEAVIRRYRRKARKA